MECSHLATRGARQHDHGQNADDDLGQPDHCLRVGVLLVAIIRL
jgi:hypothetical protein